MIQWKFDDKMGEVIFKDGHTSNLYRGNAHMIAVHEEENGAYHLEWFIGDREHLKMCLGLKPGFENTFGDFNIEVLRLNTRYKHVPSILSDLARAKTNIKIELYYEKKQPRKS